MRHTLDLILEKYGNPIFEIEISHYSDEEKVIYDVPEKVCVFATSQTPDHIIVFGKAVNGDWIPNYGHRQLIRYLLIKNKVL